LSKDGLYEIVQFCRLQETNVIDDSRNFKKPFELLYGKSFKLSCWEECVKTMLVGEIARFSCPAACVADYPTISRSLRDLYHGKSKQLKPGLCSWNSNFRLQLQASEFFSLQLWLPHLKHFGTSYKMI